MKEIRQSLLLISVIALLLTMAAVPSALASTTVPDSSVSAPAVTDSDVLLPFFTIEINKKWINAPAQVPGVQFRLYGDGQPAQWYNRVTLQFETVPDSALYMAPGKDTLLIPNLRYRNNTPDASVVQYTMEEVRLDSCVTQAERQGTRFTYTNTFYGTNKSVRKIWRDGTAAIPPGFVYPTVKLQLMRDGVPYLDPVYVNGVTDGSAAGEPALSPDGTGETSPWVYEWKGLPERNYKDDGSYTLYAYTVTEPEVPYNFSHTVDPDGNMVNSYQPGTFTASKYWSGAEPGESLPPVTLELRRKERGSADSTAILVGSGVVDGNVAGLPVPGAAGEWTPWAYTWVGLPDTVNGLAVEYLVREAGNAPNYMIDRVSSTSVQVVNVAQKMSLTVYKKWVGVPANDQPEPKFTLYRSYYDAALGRTIFNIESVETMRTGMTSITWNDLDRFRSWDPNLAEEDQVAYFYTVQEEPLPNYMTSKGNDGLTFTNTHVPATGTLSVSKDWYMDLAGSDYPAPTHELVYLRLYRHILGSAEKAVPLEEAPLIELPINLPDHTVVSWQNIQLRNESGLPYIFRAREVDANGNDHMPENFVKTETGTSVANTIIAPKDRLAGLTITTNLTNGGNEPPLNENGEPVMLSFRITGPYGYDRTVAVKAGGTLALERQMLYGNYAITAIETPGATALPGSTTFRLTRLEPHAQIAFSIALQPRPAPISVNLPASKQLEGRELRANEFTFVLKDWSGNELERVGNREDGSIVLSARRFSRTGIFLYTLQEEAGSKRGMIYDKAIHTYRVEVSNTGGTLTASVSYLKDGVPYASPPKFINRYLVPETGDNYLHLVYVLLAMSALLTGAAVFMGKRRTRR